MRSHVQAVSAEDSKTFWNWAEKQEYDKVTVVMICMNEKEKVQPGSVHYLLNVLFSNKMLIEEKVVILEEVFGLQMTKEMEEEIREMCNWSEAFWEDGREQGIQQGVQACVAVCKKFGLSKELTVLEVKEQFSKDFLYAKDMVELNWQ